MNNQSLNKSTARDWQRSLFIGSLAEQLEKMAKATGAIESEMQGYLDEGMSSLEAEELLMAEGYDLELVKSCSTRFSTQEDSPEIISKWGYRIGDNNGRIVSHIEMDSVIEASTEDDAKIQLKQIIEDSGADASFKNIIEVFKID